EINHQEQQQYELNPKDLGLPICQLNDLIGGSSAHNAMLLKEIVANQPSHLADTAILNAGAALYVYGKTANIKDGIALVREHIANGAAQKTLEDFIHA
ncbi:MAG: anthranilate phosphoribosyltransferase, partial [Gammaproteobacteria bacterium]